MRRERVSQEETGTAIRQQGLTSPVKVDAVVVDTDGTFSVIQNTP